MRARFPYGDPLAPRPSSHLRATFFFAGIWVAAWPSVPSRMRRGRSWIGPRAVEGWLTEPWQEAKRRQRPLAEGQLVKLGS